MPKRTVTEVPEDHRKRLRVVVGSKWKSHKTLTIAQFERLIRDWAASEFNLTGNLPPVYRQMISALRYEMTDLRTPEELLATTRKPRKHRAGFKGRRKRPAPKVAVLLHRGKPVVLDSHKDVLKPSVADLGAQTYPTFGTSGDIQILTPGPVPMEPPALFFGPLLPPQQAMPSVFTGPVTLEPTGIQPPLSGWKVVDWQEITSDRLRTWTGRNRNDYGGQQNAIMGNVSAYNDARYAFSVSSGIPEEVKKLDENDWEWLHLVAFSMGGINNVPQQANNLVAGTYHANTEMMLYENSIKALVDETKEPLHVRVEAHLIMHTHVADSILYLVERRPHGANPRRFTIETNPLAFNEPAHGTEKMVYELLKKELFG